MLCLYNIIYTDMTKLVVKKWDRYWMLCVIKEVDKKRWRRAFLCKCDCWNTKVIVLDDMRSGMSKACGCQRNKDKFKHWLIRTRQYMIWRKMKDRCSNKREQNYKNYWWRGIRVCDRWQDFMNFREDMKSWYEDHLTIDRIDSNGHYNKENCRRITNAKQQSNKRNNIKYKGKLLKRWCEELWVKYQTVYMRIRRWRTKKDALRGKTKSVG